MFGGWWSSCCSGPKEPERIITFSSTDEDTESLPQFTEGPKLPQVAAEEHGRSVSRQSGPTVDAALEEDPCTTDGHVASVDDTAGQGGPGGDPAQDLPNGPEKACEMAAEVIGSDVQDAEKLRLRELINRFAKQAVKGCSCTHLDYYTGCRSSATYRLDQQLEVLCVKPTPSDQADSVEARINLIGIRDVFSLVDDGDGCFPAKVLDQVRKEERELLLMLVYDALGGDTDIGYCCILEESVASRDDLLECLRVLSVYAQSAAAEAAGADADKPNPPTT
eukprot:TRINITY_DN9798_c0_g1_i1.p1 TRINITY_DN9798_c0_g1~~TRINITY_DN9798_c0_g1_i1.p1  ORF type:complete len:278 (-),score=66.08 TRINITY_DN9798_c0_g1_i1:82-915(-)